MKYAIQVNNGPCQSHAGETALQFIYAALAENHDIVRVFFYRDGVYHAFKYITPPNDEYDGSKQWSALASQYNIDLVVCISAAQRRALLSQEEADRQNKMDNDLADGFRISGLGQLTEAILLADRYLCFGV